MCSLEVWAKGPLLSDPVPSSAHQMINLHLKDSWLFLLGTIFSKQEG